MKITKVSVRVGRKFVPTPDYRFEPLEAAVEMEAEIEESTRDLALLRETAIDEVETMIVEATKRLYPQKEKKKR